MLVNSQEAEREIKFFKEHGRNFGKAQEKLIMTTGFRWAKLECGVVTLGGIVRLLRTSATFVETRTVASLLVCFSLARILTAVLHCRDENLR